MAGRKLVVMMGRFTGKKGLQVYERLKTEVDSKWGKFQQTPAKNESFSKPFHSEADIMEDIVVRALDAFLNELPAKELWEKKVRQTICDRQWIQVVGIDEAIRLETLEAECCAKHLPHTGDKKKLAWRLLKWKPK